MLSQSDASLIARDPSVSGLKLLLDSEALFAALAERLPDRELVGADTEYLRYKPGVSCLARIQLHTKNGESSAYAMAYQNRSSDKLRKASAMCDAKNSRPILFPEHAIVVYPFPLDRRLPSLGRFMHRKSILDLVRRAAPSLLDGRKDVEFSTLRYKPERRYVAQLSESGRPFAALKMYSDDGYDRAWRATKIIGGTRNVSYVRCIGHSERHKSLVFDWVHGTPLSEFDADTSDGAELFDQAARTLRTFHSIRTKKLPIETIETTLERLSECQSVLTWLSGDLAEQVRETCETIARRLSEAPPQDRITIHGDLHLKQFVVGNDGPRLLDFDRTRLSVPAEDLGSLLGYFRRRTINAFDREEFDHVFHRFLSVYEAAGGQVDHNRIEVYAALRLIELAVEPFRSRHPEWESRMRRFLEASQQILGMLPGAVVPAPSESENRRSTGFIEVSDPFNITCDERLPSAPDAIDPYVVNRRFYDLASAEGEHAGVELKRVTVLRYRRGRRCVVEYAGRSRTTGKKISLIAKMNAKDRHQSQFDRQNLLWNAGFHETCPDGVSVARPWSVIPEWRMWLAEKARGHSSWRALQSLPDNANVARRVAYSLAKLHNAAIEPPTIHSIETEMEILHTRLTAAADQVPHLADRVLSLLQECQRIAAEHRPADFCPVHRDFYPDQVLVDGEQIVLVDFDLLSMGEAAVDVGNFRAHLFEHGLRYPEFAPAYAACDTAFVGEYTQLRPAVTAGQITVYTILSLARHVSLCTSRPGYNASMLRILEACERLIQVETNFNNGSPATSVGTFATS